MSRGDFKIIRDWISAGSRVLDLACGDGQLLHELKKEKQVGGYGLEINSQNIEACLEKGVNVIEQNLDWGLGNFNSVSFDTVIMTQALQVMHFPHLVLEEMLRVGRQCIITFPNFGHWHWPVACTLLLMAVCRYQNSCLIPIPGMTHPIFIFVPCGILRRCVGRKITG